MLKKRQETLLKVILCILFYFIFVECMCIYDYVLILFIADIEIVDVNTNYI